MSWSERKPVTGKLPSESGSWQGNRTVETLTGYWDDLLCDLKDFLDDPKGWLDIDLVESKYLDYLGALCGLGRIWLDYDEATKRRLIRNHQQIILHRGSREGLESLINSVCPGSTLIHYTTPRADIALADLAVVNDFPTNRYMICLPTNIERGSQIWRWVEKLKNLYLPIGEVSIQYQINLPNKTVAGDWSIN